MEHLLNVLGAIAAGIQTADDAADTRAGYIVDGYTHLFYYLQRSCMGGTLGTTASQHQSYLRSMALGKGYTSPYLPKGREEE